MVQRQRFTRSDGDGTACPVAVCPREQLTVGELDGSGGGPGAAPPLNGYGARVPRRRPCTTTQRCRWRREISDIEGNIARVPGPLRLRSQTSPYNGEGGGRQGNIR